MKKNFFILISFVLGSLLFSQEQDVPELLRGVWYNSDRYVVFDSGCKNTAGDPLFQIVLRTFYRWYDDRAAESRETSEKNPRDVNNTTQKTSPQEISVRFIPVIPEIHVDERKAVSRENGDILLAEDFSSGAWNLEISYPGRKEKTYVPVAVIGDGLYLDFLVKPDDSEDIPYSDLLDGNVLEAENLYNGFWRDCGNSNGILVSPSRNANELRSYYVDGDSVYQLRYWRTDMDFDPSAQVSFSDMDKTFYVSKHLRVSGETFTCVTGRSKKIRNVKKSARIAEKTKLNSMIIKKKSLNGPGKEISYSVRTATICCIGDPYLKRKPAEQTIDSVMEEDSRKTPPVPGQLFPPHGILDFDWSVVEDPPEDYDRRVLDLGK